MALTEGTGSLAHCAQGTQKDGERRRLSWGRTRNCSQDLFGTIKLGPPPLPQSFVTCVVKWYALVDSPNDHLYGMSRFTQTSLVH